MLVMVQQVQMVQISLVLTLVRVRHLLITHFFGNQAGYQASDASFQISWADKLVIAQQVLVVQISWATSWL
jgi:hypothetical protein